MSAAVQAVSALTIDGPCVYFLLSHDRKMVKIGKSKSFKQRASDLAAMNAYPVTVEALITGYTNIERWFHNEWRMNHTDGNPPATWPWKS